MLSALVPKTCYGHPDLDMGAGVATPTRQIFRRNLRLAMKEGGFNSARLAGVLGVTPAAISRYLTGSSEPDFKTLQKLSIVLNKPVYWFLKGPGDPSDPAHSRSDDIVVEEALRLIEMLLSELKTLKKA
jgi:transcriptional regulator with XRE-family HTH domain